MAATRQGFLRRWGFPLAALSLLVLAAWLSTPERERPVAPRALDFPRYQRPHEIERQRQRALAPVRSLARDAGAAPRAVETEPAFDPMQRALAGGELALVLEARVLSDSPIGRKLLACLSPSQRETFEELEARFGFDPRQRIDRVGLSGGAGGGEPVVILTGELGGFDPERFDPSLEVVEHGPRTRLVDAGSRVFAFWDERALLFGVEERVLEVLDRLDGNSPSPETFPSDEAYGEVYGSLSGEALASLLPPSFGARMREAAGRVLLHVDASSDLLLVADVRGEPGKVEDLGTAVGGALAMGRLRALQQEDPLLAELLDQSRVIPGRDGFQLEMALPLSAIEAQLGECARAADPDGAQPAP